jgi:putative ABC transport system permease protein
MGTDVLYVDRREWFTETNTKWEEIRKREKITFAQARAVERNLTTARGVTPTVNHMVDSVRYGTRSSGMVIVVGTTEQFPVTAAVEITAGRFLTKTEAHSNRDLCVVGSEVAEKLFDGESPLGKRIRIAEQPFEVIGVLAKRGTIFGQISLDNQILIPIQRLIRNFRWDPSCTIQSSSPVFLFSSAASAS